MSDDERDPLLDRLREIDPARDDDGAEALVRASVKERAASGELDQPRSKSWRPRTKLIVAGATALAAVGAAFALFGNDAGITPGPDRALAIERGPNGVTLTITNPNAGTGQMNHELAEAGIERVRVISVPGSPTHAGRWAGTIDLIADCTGGTTRSGFGVRIVYHPDNGVPAPAGVVHLKLPKKGRVRAGVGLQRGAGKRAIVSTDIDDPRYGPAILIAVHPRAPGESESAKDITADDLIDLGGVFAQYGNAVSDGFGQCSELGLQPPAQPVFPPADGDWVTTPIDATDAGAAAMTQTLHDQGLRVRAKAIPAQPEEVGGWLGWERRPDFPPSAEVHGNVFDILTGDPAHPEKPSSATLALRRDAFAAYPDAHWVFWFGREARPGEAPLVVGPDGPVNAAAALRDRCKGIGGSAVSANGRHRWCTSTPTVQVPRPDDG